jgi:hypothetical protein
MKKVILKSIEPHTFQQVVDLSPKNMMHLIDTVCTALDNNPQLANFPQQKIEIACLLLSYANSMLEDCGSTIETTIHNPTWNDAGVYYKTKEN